jgi:hypothetical protein
MEELLGLWADESNEEAFVSHKVLFVIKRRVCLMTYKKKTAATTHLKHAKAGSLISRSELKFL